MTQTNSKASDRFEIKRSYHVSGALWYETPYVNGEENGILKVYYESGVLRYETPYVNGSAHGIEKIYYESGALLQETIYDNGKRHGILKYYDEDKMSIAYLILYNEGRILLSLQRESEKSIITTCYVRGSQ